ncbi:MAG: head-tail connector protein [Beijerinckiaceae bacterium]
MRRFNVNGPAAEPLTLVETKRWLRVDHDDDDGLILSLIKAARERIEARTGRALMAQTWRVVMDRWPAGQRIRLPLMPVMSITAIRLLDASSVASVVAASAYTLDGFSEPPVLSVSGVPQPGRERNGIEIDLVAGYGVNPQDCPEPLRQAMRLLVGSAYEQRGPERAGKDWPVQDEAIEQILAPYRVIHFGRSVLEDAA